MREACVGAAVEARRNPAEFAPRRAHASENPMSSETSQLGFSALARGLALIRRLKPAASEEASISYLLSIKRYPFIKDG